MLTEEQSIFLIKHDIPETLTFNALGLSKKEYHSRMKSEEKIIAYNVTPCKSNGHTLRTRNGHCIQCDTAKIAYAKRNISYGTIYIAGSLEGELIKIGYTQKSSIRIESLNRTKYADRNDWEILYSSTSIKAAEIENYAHLNLKRYTFTESYAHDHKMQKTREIFKCSYGKAKEAIEEIVKQHSIQIDNVFENKQQISKYNFQNLIRK